MRSTPADVPPTPVMLSEMKSETSSGKDNSQYLEEHAHLSSPPPPSSSKTANTAFLGQSKLTPLPFSSDQPSPTTSSRPSKPSTVQAATAPNQTLASHETVPWPDFLEFKPGEACYLVPFLAVTTLSLAMMIFNILASRNAYREKKLIKDLEFSIALKEATSRQQTLTRMASLEENSSPDQDQEVIELDDIHPIQEGEDQQNCSANDETTQQLSSPLRATTAFSRFVPKMINCQAVEGGEPVDVVVSAASETDTENPLQLGEEQGVMSWGSFHNIDYQAHPTQGSH